MTFEPTESLAPAKVNLCLHITGRRTNGYHELDSVVAFADIGDVVGIRPVDDRVEMRVSCRNMPGSGDPTAEVVPLGTANLAWRALAAGAAALGGIPGIIVSLEKRLPAGAGLGGGSSDAAAVLRLMMAAYGGSPSPTVDAAGLGADVPMCLDPRPWRARGLGEVLAPLTFANDLPAVLVWPGRPVATPAVFQARRGPFGSPVPDAALTRLATDPLGALAGLRNDLTDSACRIEPVIVAALEAVRSSRRCRLTRMTGSGSTVFGLFDDDDDARHAADELTHRHPDWWVRPTRLRGAAAADP